MTPLVLVHGFLGGAAHWTDLAVALHPRPVVALDLPGFGAAARQAPLPSIAAYGRWVIETLAARGIERYGLLGHSMGGMIAQEIARQDAPRVERLVLYGTGPDGVLPGRFETIAESKRRAQVDGPGPTARRIAATWLLQREEAALYGQVAAVAELAGLGAILAGLDAMAAWSGGDALSDVACPTLVLWGDQDRTYGWSQTATLWRGINGAQLCVVPQAAHLVHLDAPDVFVPVLRSFLAS
ncbi:MAG: alpha/beta fold hydrolase [Pseudomonadota bacterium]